MPGLFIIAHTPLASALKAVAAHVDAEAAAQIATLDVLPEWSAEQVEAHARPLLDAVRNPQALILSDVQGATPSNVGLRLTDGQNVRMVAGVNVPMLWRALCYVHLPLEQLVERAAMGGAQGAVPVSLSRPQHQTLQTRAHDQDHSQNQQ